jgi:hypothetical protein
MSVSDALCAEKSRVIPIPARHDAGSLDRGGISAAIRATQDLNQVDGLVVHIDPDIVR